MKGTVTAREIAEAKGVHRTSIVRVMNDLGQVFVWKKGPSGPEKHYPITLLPEDYRVAVMASRATAGIATPEGEIEQIGAEAAKGILTARAEEKERELIAKEQAQMAFQQMPEQRQKEAMARYTLLQLCDGFALAAGFTRPRHARRSKKADQAFAIAYNTGKIKVPAEVAEVMGQTTSGSTVRRIAEAYDRYGLPGLACGYHNPKRGQTTLSPEQQEMVIDAMCLNPSTSNTNIHRMLQGKFGRDIPSATAIGRFREGWISKNADLWMYYTNPDEYKSKKRLAFGSTSERVERLNQLWEADSTPADLMLVDGRHTLIGVIDVYSRRLRLFVSKTSKSTAIVALLRHCFIEWGIAEVLKIDNGKDYRSARVNLVLESLDIEAEYCTPFSGDEKPHIERAFRTFLHGLVEMMPGYIGHNVTERQAIRARRSFAERVMQKGGDPVEVNLTSEQLQKMCNEWTTFVYQHDPHSGIDGRKPIDMVRNWPQPIRRVSDLRVLDMLLLPAPKDGGLGTITKKGVRIDNRYYQSRDFAGHVGERVFVLLDPADMGTAYIYLYGNDGERTFLCVAIDPQWYDIDRAKFSVSAKNHSDKIMKEGSKELRKRAKKESIRDAYQDYMDFRKSEVANLLEFPVKAEELTTPMLTQAARAVEALDLVNDRQAEMSANLRDSGVAIDIPAVPEPPPAKEKKVIELFTCKSDIYCDIFGKLKKAPRPLTRWENEFLTDFYTTDSVGKQFLMVQGDLRQKYGTVDADQAES